MIYQRFAMAPNAVQRAIRVQSGRNFGVLGKDWFHEESPRPSLPSEASAGRDEGFLRVYEQKKQPRRSKPVNEAHERDLYAFEGNDGKVQIVV